MSDMNDPNSVLIEGKALRDPELRYTPGGIPMCRFTLVTRLHDIPVMFLDVRTGARLAGVCGECVKKGGRVQVSGKLEQERWVDSEGIDRSRIYVEAESVEFDPPRQEDGGE